MVGNTVFFDKMHEVDRGITGERRLGEVSIARQKVLRAGMKVGEVTAAAAGDEYLLPDSIRAFEQ